MFILEAIASRLEAIAISYIRSPLKSYINNKQKTIYLDIGGSRGYSGPCAGERRATLTSPTQPLRATQNDGMRFDVYCVVTTLFVLWSIIFLQSHRSHSGVRQSRQNKRPKSCLGRKETKRQASGSRTPDDSGKLYLKIETVGRSDVVGLS